MRFYTISLLVLALLTGLGSCARHSTPSGKLRLNLGAIASPVINGMYIWGHNKTFGLTFGAHIQGDGRDIELPLKPGVWNFKVMAWDGDKTFEGITRCGISPDIAFQNDDVDVAIHLSTDCRHPFFSGGVDKNFTYTKPVDGGGSAANEATPHQITPLTLVTCQSLELIDKVSDHCLTDDIGATTSFRIILPSYAPRNESEIGDFSPDSLSSECHEIETGTSLKDTNLHIPVGDSYPESPRVYIAAYTVPNCEGAPDVIKYFPRGLLGAIKPNGKLFPDSDVDPQKSVFFIRHADVASSSM